MHKKTIALLCATAVVLSASFAQAAPVGPVNYGSPPGPVNNSLNVDATVDGELIPQGFIQLFTPSISTILPGTPQDLQDPLHTVQPTPIQLDPNVHPGGVFAASTTPAPLGIDFNGAPTSGAMVTIAGQPSHRPISTSNLNLDLLNGQTMHLVLQQFSIYWVDTFNQVSQLPVNADATITKLDFFQTGASTFNHVTGEFSIDGTVKATFNAGISVPPLLNEQLEDQEFDIPLTLTGTATSTRLFNVGNPLPDVAPGDDITLTLAGDIALEIPLNEQLELIEVLVPGLAGVTATVDLAADIIMNLNYSIEDVVLGVAIVPEPGTIVLAGIGLLGMIPLVRRRFRK